ncbi:MAG: diguanylate cyclase [Bacteroidetes bacterium]|nr:MAG: diguanylate cyclase [Bacteroidota bacterium]PTM12837.1 MAG: diguanylate cyclase [Bacteroidota bacterium]
MIFLAILLLLNFSCSPKNASETKADRLTTGTTTYGPSNQDRGAQLKYTSGIRSILHDSKGNYWLGSHQEGVCLFDGKSFTYFTVEDGLSDHQVRTIQEDENGIIWFGTANGVSSYDGKGIVNHTPSSLVEFEPAFPNKWTKTDNDLWFSAGNKAGVYRLDGKKMNYLAFPIQTDNSSFDSYSVTGLAKGKRGCLWMATYAAVFGFDGKSFRIIDDESLGYTEQTGRLHLRSILEDSSGNLWMGNNGIGVLLMTGDTTINFSAKEGLIHANSSKGGAPSPAGTLEHVFAIAEDRQGNIWFGDRDTGAWKYDGKSMTNYTVDDEGPTSNIWAIYQDRNGELLFAMGNGGVYKLNGIAFARLF